MIVKRAKSAGFCLGVSLALRTLDHEVETHPTEAKGRIITLGPIIHNPLVMQEYKKKGVVCHDSIEHISSRDKVIIRAHGIPVETEERLSKLGANAVDATCPKVKKAQLAILKHRKKHGGTLLLFGEADHPEVLGLVSYAGGDALVFGNLEELADLHIDPASTYFLAAQTTQERTVFKSAEAALVKRLGRTVPVLNTICDATRKRQEEVIALCDEVEAMVVVGGKNSGNTRRLAEVARACGVIAIHVEDVAELDLSLLDGVANVGLTAGASTPEAHIDAMHRYLLAITR